MSENDSSDPTLRGAFGRAEAAKTKLENTCEPCNSSAYQSNLSDAIAAFTHCKQLVRDLSLFSPNESLEDISSSELRYLLLEFQLGELVNRQSGANRKATVLSAQQHYKDFLRLCDSYDLLSKEDQTAFESVLRATSPESMTHFPKDPGARRQAKIAKFKQEKEIKQKLEALKANPHLSIDDDILRDLWTTTIKFSIMQALQAMEGVVLELDMLKMAPPPTLEPSRPQENEDERVQGRKNDEYSDRLDNPNLFTNKNGAPLLSADGKPLRPFTIVDARSQIRKGVFRPGHNLPTMSIDEYLEEERRRGNIIEGGGEKSGLIPEPDEDDYEKADAETMKAREWDEFVEANPRGAGNTINRG